MISATNYFSGIEGLNEIAGFFADPAFQDSILSSDDQELTGMHTDLEEQLKLMRQWLTDPDIAEDEKATIREILGE